MNDISGMHAMSTFSTLAARDRNMPSVEKGVRIARIDKKEKPLVRPGPFVRVSSSQAAYMRSRPAQTRETKRKRPANHRLLSMRANHQSNPQKSISPLLLESLASLPLPSCTPSSCAFCTRTKMFRATYDLPTVTA
jgi:hypothetical protein